MKFGAIDIGTNAARLLIGEVLKNEEGYSFIKKISYTRVPLRLGMDVFEKGKISSKKKGEFIKTIKAFKLISEVFDVEDLRACATSAMREAENGIEVQKEIKQITGVNIEIIDGTEEAQLIFSTFFLLDFEKNNPFIVIDVGGGSTEISIFVKGKIVAAKSFKVGTIRYLQGKVKTNVWTKINEWLNENIDIKSNYQIFGTGGNINKIHKLFGKQYLKPLYLDELDDLYKSLEPLSIKQRIKKFNLKQDRADVIVPALKIYIHCLNHLKAYKIYAPKIGLSDGIIYDLHTKYRN
ncbi:MAG TPA: exopolyphosphatase [Crocinitomix sp.]|nr:exopolyphosphatase [Crocinitomix sp.]